MPKPIRLLIKWEPIHEQAIDLLAFGFWSNKEVARRLNVSRMTLFRWQRDPLFAWAIERRREGLTKEEIAEVQSQIEREVLTRAISRLRSTRV